LGLNSLIAFTAFFSVALALKSTREQMTSKMPRSIGLKRMETPFFNIKVIGEGVHL